MPIDNVNDVPPRVPQGRHRAPLAMLGAVAMLLAAVAMPAAADQNANRQLSGQANYSEEELESFAAASLRVQKLNQEWVPKITSAKTPQESQTMRSKAVEQMTQAVRDEGLSLADYNGIYKAAKRDPKMAATIQAYMQDAR